jgi:hypothetical protein
MTSLSHWHSSYSKSELHNNAAADIAESAVIQKGISKLSSLSSSKRSNMTKFFKITLVLKLITNN